MRNIQIKMVRVPSPEPQKINIVMVKGPSPTPQEFDIVIKKGPKIIPQEYNIIVHKETERIPDEIDKSENDSQVKIPDKFIPKGRGIYYRPSSGFYYIRFKDPNNCWKWLKAGASKKSAMDLFAKITSLVVEKRYFDIKPDSMTLWDEIAQDYLSYSNNNKRSHKRDAQLNKHLKEFFSDKLLTVITPHLVEEYKTFRMKMEKKPAPGTVNRELSCLRAMFNWAIKGKKATSNPVRGMKFFKEDNIITRFASKEEIKTLLAHCPANLKPLVICALSTGMRQGELLNLKWEDVLSSQKVIRVRSENAKSGKMREIPINDELAKVLRDCYDNRKSEFVFKSRRGERYRQIVSLFRSVVKKSGIKHLRFHDLRHTFASHLVMAGVDLITVKEILGHSTVKMTERYAHLSKSHKHDAVQKLGDKLKEAMAADVQTDKHEKE